MLNSRLFFILYVWVFILSFVLFVHKEFVRHKYCSTKISGSSSRYIAMLPDNRVSEIFLSLVKMGFLPYLENRNFLRLTWENEWFLFA